MDINKIASIISEDISVNNGVVFERDVSGGRAQKKAMAMKRFYDQMWGKLTKAYQKARKLGQEHEDNNEGQGRPQDTAHPCLTPQRLSPFDTTRSGCQIRTTGV